MERKIDSKKATVPEPEGKPGPSEPRVDEQWCSDLCKKKISTAVIEKYPCKQKFSRVDVAPLYASGAQRFYRVTLWINDWSRGEFGPTKMIWKTFSVILEGIERKIVSIEEGKKKKG